jgi:hypothetical protein
VALPDTFYIQKSSSRVSGCQNYSNNLPNTAFRDQALGGAMINASGQIGRSIGLAISTAIQTAFMARAKGIPVTAVGKIEVGDLTSLMGIRVANWFNFALALCCIILCGVSFRGTGIVGQIPILAKREDNKEVIVMTKPLNLKG